MVVVVGAGVVDGVAAPPAVSAGAAVTVREELSVPEPVCPMVCDDVATVVAVVAASLATVVGGTVVVAGAAVVVVDAGTVVVVVVVVEEAGVCVTVMVRLMVDSSRVNQLGPVAVTVHVPLAVALMLPDELIEQTPGVDDA